MEFSEFCRDFEKLTSREEKNSVFFREGEALLSELMKRPVGSRNSWAV
jgi:hypothetical protein